MNINRRGDDPNDAREYHRRNGKEINRAAKQSSCEQKKHLLKYGSSIVAGWLIMLVAYLEIGWH